MELLNQYTFDQYYINSIIASGGSTLFVALITVPAAYGFTKYRYRGSGKVFMSCVLMRMIPFITLMVPLYMYMSWFGLLNTRMSLIIANTTFNLPFSLWIMEGYFRTFPNELIESASIDGSSRMGTLLKIVVPISLPSISTVVILTFLNTWKEFMFASVSAQSVSSRTITVGIAMLTQQYGIRWDLMSAAGTICIIPVLLITIIFQKKIMRGMTMGALKG
jgi:multiple sugar transport system permease protein